MTEQPINPLHPSLQFLIIFVICSGCMIVGAFIGIGIIAALYGLDALFQIMALNTSEPYFITSFWILQISSTTIPLCVAPVIFARFTVRQPDTYLKTAMKAPLVLFLIVFGIMILSMPLIQGLGEINQKMVLPHFLKGLETWMREKENIAAKEMGAVLQMKTIGSMLFNLLEIGLLTAIAEELLFRGCVQTIFTKWTNNKHWGIWIAAILFSAFHVEFFGFLPRLLLGVFFGYFVVWSGSIWTSVCGHFINNGTIVLFTWLYQQKKTTLNPDDNYAYNYGIYAFSLIITLFLFFIYRYFALSKKRLPEY